MPLDNYRTLSTGLGSASAIVDSGGQKVNETRYLPFGGYRSGGPNTLTDRGFTGHKENMTDLGLIYMNARYYAPGLGRFLSADTIVPNPTNPQSLNRYSYVLNQPTVGTDPDGHCYPLCTILAGGVIGGVAGGVTYYLTTPAAERNFSDASLAVGVGAVGGALIGTGIGIAAAATTTTVAAAATTAAASTMYISAGSGTIAAAGTNMILNGIFGSSFDRTDFALGAGVATLEGAFAPGLGPVKSVVSSGIAGAGESMLSDLFHGQNPDWGDATFSAFLGAGSGAAGSAVEGLAKGAIGSSSDYAIKSGAEFVNFASSTNNEIILRQWQNATAKQSGLSSLRTLTRNMVWDLPEGMVEEMR